MSATASPAPAPPPPAAPRHGHARDVGVRVAGAVSVATGCAVLLGWALHLPWLMSLSPRWVSMKPNTALGFVLVGAALSLSAGKPGRWSRALARTLAGLVGLLGALTLAEFTLDWSPGFDQWLFTEAAGTVGTSHPGRMAPTTAACFALLGTALLLLATFRRLRTRLAASVIGLLLSVVAVLDLFARATRPFDTAGLLGLTVMAVHTAALFFVLGVALAVLAWPPQVSITSPLGKTVTSFALCTLLFAGSLTWNLQDLGQDTIKDATSIARANIHKDFSFRRWAASHGGVYVRPTAHTPPNPYLEVPNRDLVSTTGIALTLMNPAYMLREMQSEFGNDYGLSSRITSLEPLNPLNAPDAWEARALALFESSPTREVIELTRPDGKPFLRVLQALPVNAECLGCHEHQGYRVGDIRGGIGSTVALGPMLQDQRDTSLRLMEGHGLLWAFCVLGLGWLYRREYTLSLVAEHETAFSDAVINSMPGAFFAYEDGLRLARWNKNLEVLSGCPPAELLGKHPLDWFDAAHRSAAEAGFQAFAEGHESGFEGELRFRGRPGPCLLAGSWLRVGTRRFLVCVGLDLTAQQALQQELRQAQKMESIGRLAGGVAHDFNNLLTVIQGNAEVGLAEATPGSPFTGYFEEIREAADRSAALTRQLLAFARRQPVTPRVLDLNDTVTAMLKMLQRLIGESIHLRWQPAPSLWSVKMDPSQVDQVLANLCVNARDAITDVGHLDIETANQALDATRARPLGLAPGDYVTLTLRDSGIGMSEETLGHLFEPFFTTKGTGKGTGLGLATVFGIAKQNGGHVTAQSTPGQGTVFTLYLPRHHGAGEAAADGHQPAATRGDETILLVEDEQAILDVTATALEKQGYTVLRANRPEEALRLLEAHAADIDLLITDIVMPGMNGRDVAQRAQALSPRLKCLFVSGYTADVIAHHGVLEPGVNFLQKPFAPAALASRVRAVLDQPA